jgi:sigma-B regulation protein RsbU (phosphoserine phosphatase)
LRQSAPLSEGGPPTELEQLRDLYDNAPAGYLVLEEDGRISRVNRTLAAWLERDPDEVRGQSLHNILTMGSQMLLESHLAPLLALNGFFDEVALDLVKNSPGERLPVMTSAMVVPQRGRPSSTRMIFIRATERRRHERELIEARAAAESARKELEQSLAAEREVAKFREQFIAVLGHDLRNPLAAINSGLNMLSRDAPDEATRLIIVAMQATTLRMRGLIDNVLDFARARLGKGLEVIIDRPTPVAPVIEQVVQELRWAHPQSDIRLAFTGASHAVVDPARLAQMLSNLLGNALTHGDPMRPVTVAVSITGSRFEMSVANGGKPIPEPMLQSLFEPFSRGAASGRQGLGLGLFIASKIANAHGGTLEVDSSEVETRFTFRLAAVGGG